MAIHETYVSSLDGNILAYGFCFKQSKDHEDFLLELELGQVDAAEHNKIEQALNEHQWVAELFCASLNSDLPVIGYQVENGAGENWADRASFEVLDAEIAMRDLIEARKAEGTAWILCTVHDGDIQNPVMVGDIEQPAAFTKAQLKAELLDHLQRELDKAQGWVDRNIRDGFPEAADGHRVIVAKFQRLIDFSRTTIDVVESPLTMVPQKD